MCFSGFQINNLYSVTFCIRDYELCTSLYFEVLFCRCSRFSGLYQELSLEERNESLRKLGNVNSCHTLNSENLF